MRKADGVTTLRGVTWKHDRGLAPMLATAREFANRYPGVQIQWEVRSLHEFGDASTKSFAENYDLIVIDHPFMGEVARDQLMLPLDEFIAPATLAALESESVGASHASYFYDGHQWALAIDAASQVAGYRPDLLEEAGVSVPETWDQVFELARIRPGFVSVALFPLDSLMCFFTLCANAGHPPFSQGADRAVDHEAGEFAITTPESAREELGCGRLKPESDCDLGTHEHDGRHCLLSSRVRVFELRSKRVSPVSLIFRKHSHFRPGGLFGGDARRRRSRDFEALPGYRCRRSVCDLCGWRGVPAYALCAIGRATRK